MPVTRRAALALVAACGAACLGGCGLLGPSPEQVIREGIVADLDGLAQEDSELRAKLAESLDAAGALEGLDVDSSAFIDEFLEGFTYEVGEIEVDDEAGSATAQVKVTCRTFTDIASRLKELVVAEAASGATSTEDEFSARIGELLMQALDETKPEEAEVTLACSRAEDDTWSVDEESRGELAQMMIG